MVHFLSTLVAVGILLSVSTLNAQTQETLAPVPEKADAVAPQTETQGAPVAERKMPKRKNDAQLRKEKKGLPEDWQKMTDKERQEYAVSVLEDRFILTTSNFEVVSLASGMMLCSFDVFINNHSSRNIQKIFVNYRWGEDSTYVEFANLKPLETATGRIALAGPVCKKVTSGADYDVTTCRADGLSQDQCRLHVFGLK